MFMDQLAEFNGQKVKKRIIRGKIRFYQDISDTCRIFCKNEMTRMHVSRYDANKTERTIYEKNKMIM